ncbi:hypothetical protein KM043_006157 [Ampulex compressa]|nr:hypothetical protein KM043_006157 [Ampulex compressa]
MFSGTYRPKVRRVIANYGHGIRPRPAIIAPVGPGGAGINFHGVLDGEFDVAASRYLIASNVSQGLTNEIVLPPSGKATDRSRNFDGTFGESIKGNSLNDGKA